MSDAPQDDLAAQAWPGFVDILSSTVIMFVFFVMVIVVVLYLYTIKFTSTIKSQADQRVQDAIESTVIPESFDAETIKKMQEIRVLEEHKSVLEAQLSALEDNAKQLYTGLKEGVAQSIAVNQNEIVIVFSDNDITLTEEAIQSIIDFISANSDKKIAEITAGDNPLAITQSNNRQAVLARMLNVRNVLLDNGFQSAQTSINYVGAHNIQNSYTWVKLTLR